MTQEKLFVANGLAKKIKELQDFLEGIDRGENIGLQAGLAVPYMLEIDSKLPFEKQAYDTVRNSAKVLLANLRQELEKL